MLTLQPLSMQIDRRKFRLGAQNAYHADEGAFTGEISMTMLSELVHYVLVGHSERRHVFGETDEMIAKKAAAAVRNDLMPIICVGETNHERAQNETKQVLHDQTVTALKDLTNRDMHNVVIAYEPVWAISDGKNPHPATPGDVEKSLIYIRDQIKELHGDKVAKNVRILYGGSVNEHNANAFLSLQSCDGALIGGASLKADSFAGIVEAAYRLQQERLAS
jgi:triosephosphate isomerase